MKTGSKQGERSEEVISSYSHQQAVADGVLVEILPHRWATLTGGRPLLATRAVFEKISLAGIMEIWNKYVIAGGSSLRTPYVTKMDGNDVWVMKDSVFTILFPSDY